MGHFCGDFPVPAGQYWPLGQGMGFLLSPSDPSQKKRSGHVKQASKPVTLLIKKRSRKKKPSLKGNLKLEYSSIDYEFF